MKRLLVGLVAVWMMVGLSSSAQPQTVFKLGSFERAGKTFVGVVLRDALVIDLAEALAARPASSRIRPPGDMKVSDCPLRRRPASDSSRWSVRLNRRALPAGLTSSM